MKKLAIIFLMALPAHASNMSQLGAFGYVGVDSFLSGSKGSVQYGAQFNTGEGAYFGYELDYTKYKSEYSYGVNIKPSFFISSHTFISPIAGYHKFSNDKWSPIYGLELSHQFNIFEIRTGVKKNDSGIDDNVNYYVGGAIRY